MCQQHRLGQMLKIANMMEAQDQGRQGQAQAQQGPAQPQVAAHPDQFGRPRQPQPFANEIPPIGHYGG